MFRWKSHGNGQRGIIFRHGRHRHRKLPVAARHFRKGRIGKGTGDFPSPVGTEVKAHKAIARSNGSFFSQDGKRFDKFVGYAPLISGLEPFQGGRRRKALRPGHGIIGFLDPFPAFIAVHGIIASAHGSNLSNANLLDSILKGFQVRTGTLGRRISPVQEGMDIHFGKAFFFR